jgi:hypothetical protein
MTQKSWREIFGSREFAKLNARRLGFECEGFSPGFGDWSRDMALQFQRHEAENAAEAVKLNEGYTTEKHGIFLDINLGGDAAKALRELNEYFADFGRRFAIAVQNSDIAQTFQLLSKPRNGVTSYRNKILACADDRFTQVDKRLCPQDKSNG